MLDLLARALKLQPKPKQPAARRPAASFAPETLEPRAMLSGSPWGGGGPGGGGGKFGPPAWSASPAANKTPPPCKIATVASTVTTVEYGSLQAIYKDGLTALAQGVAIPDAQAVKVTTAANGGIASYSTVVVVNGVENTIAVDADGAWLQGTVAFSSTSLEVQAGLQTLNGTDPILPDQLVTVSTGKNKVTTYSTASTAGTTTLTVDGTGAPATIPPAGPGTGGPGGGCGNRGGGGRR